MYAIINRTAKRVKERKMRRSLKLIHSHKYSFKPILVTLWLRTIRILQQTIELNLRDIKEIHRIMQQWKKKWKTFIFRR